MQGVKAKKASTRPQAVKRMGLGGKKRSADRKWGEKILCTGLIWGSIGGRTGNHEKAATVRKGEIKRIWWELKQNNGKTNPVG